MVDGKHRTKALRNRSGRGSGRSHYEKGFRHYVPRDGKLPNRTRYKETGGYSTVGKPPTLRDIWPEDNR